MDDAVNRYNRDAVIATFVDQDVNFNENDIGICLRMSEVVSSAVKPFSLEWNSAYDTMPVGQDQVGPSYPLLATR